MKFIPPWINPNTIISMDIHENKWKHLDISSEVIKGCYGTPFLPSIMSIIPIYYLHLINKNFWSPLTKTPDRLVETLGLESQVAFLKGQSSIKLCLTAFISKSWKRLTIGSIWLMHYVLHLEFLSSDQQTCWQFFPA